LYGNIIKLFIFKDVRLLNFLLNKSICVIDGIVGYIPLDISFTSTNLN